MIVLKLFKARSDSMFLDPIHTQDDLYCFSLMAIAANVEVGTSVFRRCFESQDLMMSTWLVFDSEKREEILGAVQFTICKYEGRNVVALTGVYCVNSFRGNGMLSFIVNELLNIFNLDIFILEATPEMFSYYLSRGTKLPRCSIMSK